MPMVEISVYVEPDESDAITDAARASSYRTTSRYIRSQLKECDPDE